jgi:hypothetical protein
MYLIFTKILQIYDNCQFLARLYIVQKALCHTPGSVVVVVGIGVVYKQC